MNAKVIGFFNHRVLFPALLVTVTEDDGRFFITYPSGDKILLAPERIDNLKKARTFFLPNEAYTIADGEMALGLAFDKIFIGTPQQIMKETWEEVSEQQRHGMNWDPEYLETLEEIDISIR